MGVKLPSFETVFGEAIEIASSADRAAYLDRACGDDTMLRRHVESLLGAHVRAGDFLATPGPSPTAAQDHSPPAEGPGALIGPYKLLEEIGEGGMGVVYMAEQTHPVRRKVALKVIKSGMDSKQVVARFEAERQALALMDHPNIARVLEAGTAESGRPYFVMELVRGLPITDYCDRENVTILARLELFVLVCRAVQHAHQKGIIHRDLKPSNVLVTVVDGVPVPKIIDFGIAKATGQSLTDKTLFTGFHQLVGSPLYMSPEQVDLAEVDVDTRSDIYALGVLLYELLTGTTPFDQETFRRAAFDEMRRIIREDEPPKPSTRLSSLGVTISTISSNRGSDPKHLNRTVRGELDWIAMKALEKDRRRRYETANDFAADVMRYLTDRPVEACPPSAWYRFSKYARRHRAGLTTAGLVAIALLAGTALSTWQAIKATAAKVEARAERDRALKAEAQARLEADKAKAISDFLTGDLLLQAEPANNDVEDKVTLLEVLDRAADKVSERFGSQPEVQDAVRRTIALSYNGLGSWEKAERQWRALLESSRHRAGPDSVGFYIAGSELAHILLRRGQFDEAMLDMARRAADGLTRKLGTYHLDTLRSRNFLVDAYMETGRTAEAIAMGEAILEVSESKLGLEHVLTIKIRNSLGNASQRAGRTAEAIKLYEMNLKIEESTLGADHPVSLSNRANLAGAYLAAGRTALAIKMYEATFKLSESKLGAEHPDTLTTRTNLAEAYRRAGRTGEAIEMGETLLKLSESKFGPDHPITISGRNNVALAYSDAGRTAEAINLFQANLKLSESKFGPDYLSTLSDRNNLALAYYHAGRIAEAIKMYEATFKLKESKLGADHPDTLITGYNLAQAYLDTGRTAEAIEMGEAMLKLSESKLGPDHPRTIIGRHTITEAYRLAGRTVEAIKLHETNLKMAESKLGADHHDTLAIRCNLANAYLTVGRTTEAIEMQEATLTIEESKLGPDHPDTLVSRVNLARAYRAAGRLTDALPLFEDTLKRCKAKLGPDHPNTLIVMNELTAAYLVARRWAEAETLARDCLDLREKKQPDDWWKFHTMSQLGAALLGQKKYAEAEPLLLQGYEGLKAREAKIPAPRKDSLAESAAWIVKLYEAWGKTDKAAEWRKTLATATGPRS